MAIKILATLFGFLVLGMVALWAGAGLRGAGHDATDTMTAAPVATVSERLGEGVLEAQVYLTGNLTYRLDIQFTPNDTTTIFSGAPPSAIFDMTSMGTGSFEPPLELVGAGSWRAQGKIPMAGDWLLNVGYGDEFAEAPFVAQ